MLSPYRGVMHSVVTQWGDAVTTDGRSWTLYVRGECLYDDPADLRDRAISVPDVKYGIWSEKAGFQRAPIRLPTFDQRVRAEGDHLLAAVHEYAPRLPFPLADRYELWLLHARSGLPLALIGSGCDIEDCEPPVNLYWTPGQLCIADLPEADALRGVIAQLAGEAPRAEWFERQSDGSGTAVSVGATRQARVLPGARFAPLFVDASALDADQLRLLTALHHWQSPALLQLPTLTEAQRAYFEDAACRHALRLAEQLPLYPCVLDRTAVTAALVEARLRRSGGGNTHSTGASPALSPDYLEIPDA